MVATYDYYGTFNLPQTTVAEELIHKVDGILHEKPLKAFLSETNKLIKKFNDQQSTTPNDREDIQKALQDKGEWLSKIRLFFRKNTGEYERAQAAQPVQSTVENDTPSPHDKTTEDDGLETMNDILQRVYTLYESENFMVAINEAKKLFEFNIPDPYEIIAKSFFSLGDYEQSLIILDEGIKMFDNNVSLQWLRIRYNILMEHYQDAQIYLNDAIRRYSNNIQFYAEQVFLFLHAERDDLAVNAMKEYLTSHISDMEYRQAVSRNLINISHLCYVYDSSSDSSLIVSKEAYNRCLNLVTIANQIYQDEYTKQELEIVKQQGEIKYISDNKMTMILYSILTLVMFYFAFTRAQNQTDSMIGFILLGVLLIMLTYIVHRYNYHPVWQINRDYYRGYNEIEDDYIYNLAMLPHNILTDILNDFRR